MQQPDTNENHGASQPDEPIPTASDDRVLEETVRLAREGRQQREADPKEKGPSA